MNFADVESIMIPEGAVTKIEVGGVVLWEAKPSSVVVYFRTDTLAVNANQKIAETIGNHAIIYFAYNSTVGAGITVDDSLTQSTVTGSGTKSKSGVMAAATENHALFAGGYSSAYYSNAEAYDVNLTAASVTNGIGTARRNGMSAVVGNIALFAGGYNSSSRSSAVNTIDDSLVGGTATSLDGPRSQGFGGNTKDLAFFAGGTTGSTPFPTDVFVYDENLTKTTAANLTTTNTTGVTQAAASNGTVIVMPFNDGTADVYNNDATKLNSLVLSGLSGTCLSAHLDGFIIIADTNSSTNAVVALDSNLVQSTPDPLSAARNYMCSAVVGEYALFAGGSSSSAMDIYTIEK